MVCGDAMRRSDFAWQRARVIDPELPFCGRFIWVKGPPEWMRAGATRKLAIRTNVILNEKPVYIAVSSIEGQGVLRRKAWQIEMTTRRDHARETTIAVNPAALSVLNRRSGRWKIQDLRDGPAGSGRAA
jgi:hypothetical protein